MRFEWLAAPKAVLGEAEAAGGVRAVRMRLGAPGADGRVVLDFNRAYNPPCAFTAFATCPLPPDGNRLDLAIEAGEKAYRPAH
mgnify:CR=1 FL=1